MIDRMEGGGELDLYVQSIVQKQLAITNQDLK